MPRFVRLERIGDDSFSEQSDYARGRLTKLGAPPNPSVRMSHDTPGLTLVSAMERLPRDPTRGFRFYGLDRNQRYYSYAELQAEALRRAAHLQALGLEKGERVALIIPEPHEFVLTFLGAVHAGVVPVPIYPRASFKNVDAYIDVLRHIVTSSGSRVAFCLESNLDLVSQLSDDVESVKDAATFFAAEAPSDFTAPELTPDDLCFLQFTSGSTSKPKGVMVSHANLVANAQSFLGPHGLNRNDDDVGVSWLPLFHDMGLIGFVLGTLVCDIPVVLLPTEHFARSPRRWLELITEHKGTITFAPNFAYDLVAKRVKDRHMAELDLSTLRVAGCGAEPIRARTLQGFADKFAAAGFDSKAFLPSYGMAESTLAITFHKLGNEMKVDRIDADAMKDGVATPLAESETDKTVLEVVSCGVGFPEHEVKVVDDAGTPLGERKVGNVIARGPSVTGGYFQNVEATAEGWKNGWLQTGDLGYFADGELYICGRAKDLIIVRGANHYPQDIEWAVADLEGVRRGNVVAFPTQVDGVEELVVAAECGSRDAERLREEIKRKVTAEFGLAPHHVAPVRLGALPKTSSGKAQRRKTRALYESGGLEEHADSPAEG